MKALDLFCGAGGASMGLYQAGFEVVGVDFQYQPNYPCKFLEDDVFNLELEWIRKFDFVWASPPCQMFTAYARNNEHVGKYPDLIGDVRKLLKNAEVWWVIENVPGASLRNYIKLCGSSFGLDIRRHRIFESNFWIQPVRCRHGWQKPRFPCATNRNYLRKTVEIGVWRIPLETQRKAMGMDWMNRLELSQAVPPAYSKYIGEQWKGNRKERKGFIY